MGRKIAAMHWHSQPRWLACVVLAAALLVESMGETEVAELGDSDEKWVWKPQVAALKDTKAQQKKIEAKTMGSLAKAAASQTRRKDVALQAQKSTIEGRKNALKQAQAALDNANAAAAKAKAGENLMKVASKEAPASEAQTVEKVEEEEKAKATKAKEKQVAEKKVVAKLQKKLAKDEKRESKDEGKKIQADARTNALAIEQVEKLDTAAAEK